MLILAGVSLNATIGENGIITNAMSAKQRAGMAALEEFLQEKYVELYDNDIKDEDNKVLALIHNSNTSKYFYKPAVGTLNYVIDSEGHALYLINKTGLPDEIKSGLVGGEAGEGTFSDYQNLNDVYGVTTNLKVYYCSNGIDSLVGLAKEQLDNDNPYREIFKKDESEMYEILNEYDKDKDGIITADEVKNITQLTITKNSKISSLKELYNLNNLKELIIDEASLSNLDGIENVSGLYYIYIKNNANIGDYSKISGLKSSLKYLYLYNMPDSQFENLCKGMENTDFEKLEYFAAVGEATYISSEFGGNGKMASSNSGTATYKITSLKPFDYLSNKTKENIKYLSLQCNEISDASPLSGFKGVYLLRIEQNQLTSLNGLQNMTNLNYLYAGDNNLGIGENSETKSSNDSLLPLKGKTSLKGLHIANNKNLVWAEYISECTSLENLYLSGCSKINENSIKLISNLWFSIIGERKSIDSSLEKYFESENIITWANLDNDRYQNVISTELSKMTNERKNKVYKLDLSNSTLDNATLVAIIKNFPNVLCLNVDGCTNLTSAEFVTTANKIQQLCFMNTGITSATELARLNNAKTITSFKCNNPLIDVTKIQDLISRTKYYTGSYRFDTILACGLYNKELIMQLESCSEITQLYALNWGSYVKDTINLDLSGCTKLSSIDIQVGNNFTLSFSEKNNISRFCWYSTQGHVKFNGNVNITQFRLVRLFRNGSNYLDVFGEDKDRSFHIDELYLWNDGVNDNNFDALSVFSKININKITVVDSVQLNKTNWNYNSWGGTLEKITSLSVTSGYAPDLNFLSKNTNLTKLVMKNCSIGDISGISDLTSLTSIDFTNNGITNLFPLKKLSNLESLTLSSNPFDNYPFSVDGVSYTNLDIIASLNSTKGGSLTKIDLSNCSGLGEENLKIVSSLPWTEKKF